MSHNNNYPTLMIAVVMLIFVIPQQAYNQVVQKKNAIKVNITNPMIFGGKSYIFCYERVVGKYQAFSIGMGRMSLKPFAKGGLSDSISLQNATSEKGFNISGDYRFYLGKENKYEAPRGVYIGPYYSYNSFSRVNNWSVNISSYQGNASTNFSLGVNTFGTELGYQFVLWKRLAVDMVLLGPGMGFYRIKTTISPSLDEGVKEELYNKLNDYLEDNFPGYSTVIGEEGIKENGSVKTTALGYRYMVNIGYRF